MMKTFNHNRHRHASRRVAMAVGTALLLAACASTPMAPVTAIQAAERAITDAERQHVSNTYSPELSVARTKLGNARNAVQQEKMTKARYLADESRLSAELAIAQAQAQRAEAINEEMRRSIEILKQEMRRNTGAQQ